MPTAHEPASSAPLIRTPVPMLDLARQMDPLHDQVRAAIDRILDTRNYILGDAVSTFEREAAETLGVEHAIGCSSGTEALWLALAASNLGEAMPGIRQEKPADVITTPFSFFASASSLLRAGLRPRFADIDPSTFNLSPHATRQALEDDPGNVKGILPVHLYGQCVQWDDFTQISQDYALILVEDAAQAWGATRSGRPVGGLGTAAAFSFYPTKNLSAAGDAGMVTTNDVKVAERAKLLRSHGMAVRYLHQEVGWNSRMDGMQAAVLQVKLPYATKWNEQRAQVADRYRQLFTAAGVVESGIYPQHGIVLPATQTENVPVWHQYVIRVAKRNQLREFLTARGIGSEIYYPVPLHLQEAFAFLGYKRGDLPESERAADEVLALPIFAELREDEQRTVVDAIVQFLAH